MIDQETVDLVSNFPCDSQLMDFLSHIEIHFVKCFGKVNVYDINIMLIC